MGIWCNKEQNGIEDNQEDVEMGTIFVFGISAKLWNSTGCRMQTNTKMPRPMSVSIIYQIMWNNLSQQYQIFTTKHFQYSTTSALVHFPDTVKSN